MNDITSLTKRVELVEGATSTLINKQDKMQAEMQSQFKLVHTELAEIKSILQLVLETINTRLPQQKTEE